MATSAAPCPSVPSGIAWFAGLFEGEGCISLNKNGATCLTIGMTDRDIVERVNAMFPMKNGISVVQPKPVKTYFNQPKLRYTWKIGQPDRVREILNLILPWLGERRRTKALEVLTHLDTRPGTGGNHRARTHCPQGHEYTPENTYVRPASGERHCRTCRNAWASAHRSPINAKRRKPNGRGPYRRRD